MADVQALCKRVIVIHHGRILFDGQLAALADQFAATKTIGVTLARGLRRTSSAYGEIIEQRGRPDDRCASRAPTPRRSRPGCWRTCPWPT